MYIEIRLQHSTLPSNCRFFFTLDASDYRSGPYTVNFAEGEKIACSEIPVTEDNLDEPDEMFSLHIMPDPEGVPNIMPGPMAQTQVTIKSGKHQ